MLLAQHTDEMQEAPETAGGRRLQRFVRNLNALWITTTIWEQWTNRTSYWNLIPLRARWYKKFSFHLLQFEHDVIAEFLFPGNQPHVGKLNSVVRLTERHFPSVLRPTPTWTKHQSRCRVCSKKGQHRDVKTFCAECLSKPGLCGTQCFGLWYTKDKYWEQRCKSVQYGTVNVTLTVFVHSCIYFITLLGCTFEIFS